jgi:aarF domain-containing kinase
MAELETLGKVYPFSIPPFFALILRAFSVIEGIALTVDPDYSIVQVCGQGDVGTVSGGWDALTKHI